MPRDLHLTVFVSNPADRPAATTAEGELASCRSRCGHLIADLWGLTGIEAAAVEPAVLARVAREQGLLLEQAVRDGIRAAGARLLHLHRHGNADGTQYAVGMALEGYVSLRFDLSRDYAALDVALAGRADADAALAAIKSVLQPERTVVERLLRGEAA